MFQNNVRKYVFALHINRMLLSMFCTRFVTLWKSSFPRTPYPSEITALEPPSPFGISNGLPWGGMDIFWNHALLLQIERIETRYLSWIANSDRLHVQSALLFWLILLFCFVVAEINNLWRARARKTIIYK